MFAEVTDRDPEVRRAGLKRLAIWPGYINSILTQVLRYEEYSYAWSDCADMLSEDLCDDKFSLELFVDDLIEAPDQVVFDRLAGLLGLPTGTRLPGFAIDGHSGACVLPAPAVSTDLHQRVAVLVTLLGSPLKSVRQNAVRFLAALGPGVAPLLRAIRNTRTPGRRAAISALAELDWTELDPADQMLAQRLIRVKQPGEVPQPVTPQGEWYAVPTTDQAAVLAAFDLRDPMPVTMRMGFAPWQRNGPWRPLPEYLGYGVTGQYGQVFVTPVLDGWTLVFADSSVLAAEENPTEDEVEFAAAHRRCAELSRHFGAAHWYLESEDGGCFDQSGWCIAANGDIVRSCYYDFDIDGGVRIGPATESGSHPTIDETRAWINENSQGGAPLVRPRSRASEIAELMASLKASRPDFAFRPRAEVTDDIDDEPLVWEFRSLVVASRLSVNPRALGSHTRVQGTGVLAVPAGKPDTRRYGALPI
ncbi:hypothetical protein D5S18_25745 [Nocardia panacis]|uniref:HEAT repeat domain-containing protein n=1 Tax=Nocardia panacis TaxID=2340916 RepID=A0A3A4KM72_9NOCA|nr:hypothetical protein D5S18_25745 [Nocardia panacis]